MSGAVTLPCPGDLDATVEFFAGLGFRVESVRPADDPTVVVIAGHGVRLRLDRGARGDPGEVRLALDGAGSRQLQAPNGTRVVIEPRDPPIEPGALEPALVISRHAEAAWSEGRAGMRYRDLIPGRHGGRFIASHIHITEAGPVPDYVHHHRVRLQLIVCVGGWVRVVYQDQGAPFVLERGGAVLQAPGIRHRVLESSADLEVVELSSPADHETRADHELELPDGERPGRLYGGQRFARDLAAIEAASGGRARARIGGAPGDARYRGELRFGFVLGGALELACAGLEARLGPRDAYALPPETDATVEGDGELLEVVVAYTAD